MPIGTQTQTRYHQNQIWKKNILGLSAESEQLLNLAMVLGNFNQPDEAVKEALHYYVDSQAGVELRPEIAASLRTALRPAREDQKMSPQEFRERIHHWILNTCSPRPQ